MAPLKTQLAAREIGRVMKLLGEADDVELKLTVPDSDQRSAVMALDLEVLDAEFRQVVFFDTHDLRLSRAGIVARVRRARKGGDSVIKLRPVVPADLPRKLRRSSDFTVELDVMPGTFVCSGSLKGRVDNAHVKDVLQGTRPIRKLFSHEQRSLYAKHAPTDLGLDSLKPFGPINIAKLKFTLSTHAAVAEVWFYPDGSRILELSMKCATEEAARSAAEARAFLLSLGISPAGEQQTKTRKALQYFSRLKTSNHRHGATGVH